MVAESGHAVADELSADPYTRRSPLAPYDPSINDRPTRGDSQIRRAPNSAGLYDVLDLILDKGIVVDAFVRVSLVGIELLTVDLRVVIASVDTYLRYAEGVERLQVYNRSGAKRLPDMVGSGMKTHALKSGAEKVGKALGGKNEGNDDESGDEDGITGTLTRGVRKGVGKLMHAFTGGGDEGDEGEGEDENQGGRDRNERRDREPEAARQNRPNGSAGKQKMRR
jgi:hypothetical protein